MNKELNFSYDQSAVRLDCDKLVDQSDCEKIGSGDTKLIPNFLTTEEANEALNNLKEGKEITYQQWHHMPDKKHKLLPLSRLKIAMADTDVDGWIPHYRFPVNSQDQHGVFSFDTSPTVKKIRDRLIEYTGIQFNHAVVLLYRDGKDCIGFHKDKTLDLSTTDPIASISLGQERSYILRDRIHDPTVSQVLKLENGTLLLLGAQTNNDFYHSIPMEANTELGVRVSITFRVATTFKNVKTGEIKGQGSNYSSVNWPVELKGSHVDYYNELLDFWFGSDKINCDYRSGLWWRGIHPTMNELRKLEDTDSYITNKWGKLLDHYYNKDIDLFNSPHLLSQWMQTNEGMIALIILFDQFSRNIYRATFKAFYFDKYAIALADHLLKNNFDELIIPYKFFTYIALMHSENKLLVAEGSFGISKLATMVTSERWKGGLFKMGSVAQEHLDVLEKFGRYPHRNAVLGRSNTIEETDFLANKKLSQWMKSAMPIGPKKIAIENILAKDEEEIIESKNKLKILILHSNRQTGLMFKAKTEKYLEKKLKSIVELTYCDAPELYYPAGEIQHTIHEGNFVSVPNVGVTRAWWNATDDPKTMVYRGLTESLEYIDSLFKNEHYDGIIGFSQGGTITGIIAGLVNDYRNNKPVGVKLENISRSLRFVTIISGFYCRDTRPEFANCILEELPSEHKPELVKIRQQFIDIPSFHVWGTEDKLVDPWRSKKLSEAFSNKIIYIHPSGHFSKAIKYWPVDELYGWLKQFMPEETVVTDSNYVNECNEIIKSNSTDMYDKFLTLAESDPMVWKYLIDYDTQNRLDTFRPILTKLIAVKLKNDYEKYYVNKASGVPSALIKYAPRRNTLYRETRLHHDVSEYLGKLLNIFDPTMTCIKEEHEKRQLILCNNQYSKVLSRLLKLMQTPGGNTSNLSSTVQKAHVLRDNLEKLLVAPLSDYITRPRAEPVDISASELLQPLYTYLQNHEEPTFDLSSFGNSIDDLLNVDYSIGDIVFKRGTVCTDGRLDLCKQVIGPRGINDLIRSLNKDSITQNPKVKHLLLGNNICGNELGAAVAKFIESGESALTTWYIAGNNLDESGIKPICEALKNDKQVRQLWLKRNPLYAAGVAHLVDMFKYNSYLQVLDLTNTGLMDDGAILLLNNISPGLNHLYLSSNGLTDKTCEVLANMLHTTNIQTLGIGCNRLGDKGAKFLAQALVHPNCPLKTLELGSCGVSSIGAKYIAEALETNKTLVSLNMGFLKSTNDLDEVPNIIGSTGAVYFANMLAINNTLRALNLLFTGIQQAGIAAVAKVMSENNRTLIYFNLEQFGVPHNELSKEVIRKAIQRNKELTEPTEMILIDEVLNPVHLKEIKSVYRVQ